jgi:AraC-like DNA-binding protein
MVALSTNAVPVSAGGGIARRAIELCREAGFDTSALLCKAGLSAEEVADENARIEVAEQISVLNLAADLLQDDVLGFHLAATMELRQAGLIYFVLASSATLGEALGRAARYSTIANEGLCLTRVTCEGAGIEFACVGVPRHSDRHQMEFWATALVRISRQLTGTRLAPSHACFVHPRSAGAEEVEAFYGCSISYASEEDRVLFPLEAANFPLISADPYLNQLLVQYCEEALALRARPVEALRTRVENAVTPLLPHGKARAEEVAKELGMGVRTMSRRLAAEGLTFSGVVDALRADLARRYLEEPTFTVSQIAWLLGYQEVSAFTHAFKRWTGLSPSQIRSAPWSRERPSERTTETPTTELRKRSSGGSAA